MDFDFNLDPAGRAVTIKHEDTHGHIESIPFGVWGGMRKAAAPAVDCYA